jgi:hypothetical protein
MTSNAILSQFSQFIEAPAEPLRLPPWDPRVMHNHPEFDFWMNVGGAVFLIFIGHRFATLWFRYTREVLGIQWAPADLLAQGDITSCGLARLRAWSRRRIRRLPHQPRRPAPPWPSLDLHPPVPDRLGPPLVADRSGTSAF